MAIGRRVEFLMDPDEYERLREIARRRGVSLASLVRQAVRERYILGKEARQRALQEIFSLDLPVAEWESINAEIDRAHGAGPR